MKTILVFYTSLMPYNMIVLNKLVEIGYKLHVVRWTQKCLTPYVPPVLSNIIYYDRSSFTDYDSLLVITRKIKPDLIWTAGWIDKMYCKVVGIYRKESNIPVVAGSDTQWHGGKQWLSVLFSSFRHKRWFSHIFVSGVWQYEYARLLGFDKEHILLNNLSADVSIFSNVDIRKKQGNYPKNLLFIGRFAEVKGLSFLLEAWNSIPDRKGWMLTLIGNGPLRSTLDGYPDVIVKDFMSQDELMKEAQQSGAFILPSVFEPWALVLHEAAAAGLPILASNCCGAVPYFALEGYNGHLFIPGNVSSMKESIWKIINTPEERLLQMSYKSRELSCRINPEIVANALLSVLG